jgi:hypothetical protein
VPSGPLTRSRWLRIAVTLLAGILRERAKQAHQILQMKLGSWPNGIKLVVTSYHIKGYGSACRVHPRAVETGPC